MKLETTLECLDLNGAFSLQKLLLEELANILASEQLVARNKNYNKVVNLVTI